MNTEKLNIKYKSPEWYAIRNNGIGASEAAAALGMSPFKTNVELWEEKVGFRKPPDISGKPQVDYGNKAEAPLIKLFALDFPQYKVRVNKRVMYKRDFMIASLDGEITERETKALGIYEGKTTQIFTSAELGKWTGKIPDYYYIQILHQLYVTGWDFAVCKAQIKFEKGDELEIITRHYAFNRNDLETEMQYVADKEREFWGYVERRQRPPLLLPSFGK